MLKSPNAVVRNLLRLTGTQSLALSTVLTNLVRIVSTVILSRLLSPDVYGLTGLILSVFYVIGLLSDVGFQAYIMRHHLSDKPEFLNAVWTIHAARGAVLALIGIIVALPVSIALAKPQLTLPLGFASLTFAIDGFSSMQQYRSLRDGRVQRFALLNLLISISQTGAAIILALFIRNVWAIVGSMLVASFVRVWLSHALFQNARHAFRRDPTIAAELWRFGRTIAASSALTLVIGQIDKLAMSRILTLSQFGTYVIAASLAAAPTAFAYNYATAIVYSAASRAWRENTSFADAYYQCWGRFFYAYAFGGGVLIGGADLLVRLLYDPRYQSAALYLSILAIATSMTMLTQSMINALVGSGLTKATLQSNIVRLVWLVTGGILAITQRSAIIFVLTIGLIEVPAYVFAVSILRERHVIRWRRELTVPLTIISGLSTGAIAAWLGRVFFPLL